MTGDSFFQQRLAFVNICIIAPVLALMPSYEKKPDARSAHVSKAITMQDLMAIQDEDARIEHLMAPLNPGQRAAAMQLDGPLQTVAGAGSGKTKTLIHRCAHALLKGIPATSIMMVTFTNKGAGEIKERLGEMVGPDAEYITAGTFHSIIYRCMLKPFADHAYLEGLGLNMNECTILDDSESKALMDDAIKGLDEDSRKMLEEQEWDKDVEQEMAQARAKGLSAETYAREKIGFGDPNEVLFRLTVDVWNNYSALCRAANGIDFDDIMVVAMHLLQKDPSLGQELASKFRYIMLDEYQDTNPVQMRIMDLIAKWHENIFTVGDEKQSIYRFRGADIKVTTEFEKRYPNARIIDLDINYRSTYNILKAANCVARHMDQKISDGQLKVGANYQGDGAKVSIVEFTTDREEARMMAAAIRRDMAAGVLGKNIAVLYRSRTVKATLEQELVKSGIDYKVIGDVGFYQRAEVKNGIALLRMTFRPWDSMAILRILKNTSFGVSDASAKKAMTPRGKDGKGQTPHAYLTELAGKTRGKDGPTAVAQKVGPLLESMLVIRKLIAYGEDATYVRGQLERLWEIYLMPGVKKAAEKDAGSMDSAMENRMQNVSFLFDRFFSELETGRKAEDILDELSLLGEGRTQTERDQNNIVSLMTIHASKGLEFPHVYVPGLDADTTPGETEDKDDLEEERRVLYVAITRAMHKMTMSYALEKMKWGSRMKTCISPFVKELSIGDNNPVYKYRANTTSNYQGPAR
jgi:DNA helicase-2/ATP-dependent DNA helicase PcrA